MFTSITLKVILSSMALTCILTKVILIILSYSKYFIIFNITLIKVMSLLCLGPMEMARPPLLNCWSEC